MPPIGAVDIPWSIAPDNGPASSGGRSSTNGIPSFSILNSPMERFIDPLGLIPLNPNGTHLLYAHVTSNVPI